MKVCSLYGAGYYYMPGTDICLKLGGYVRYQLNYNSGNSISGGPQHGSGGFDTRTNADDLIQRVRALATIDTRQQTAYGTLRSYMMLGWQHDISGAGAGLYVSRGFIQIAGFTFGKATSFFDIFPNASFAYAAGNNWSGDSGDGGVILMSYTAQFGNGFSGTIGIEQQRRLATVYTQAIGAGGVPGAPLSPYALGAVPAASNLGGVQGGWPDVVGNLRLDQSWGTWIVAAALHNISASYYAGGAGAAALNEAWGHPDEKWGFAVTTGFILNLPMITPGDRFSVQAVYSQGATGYHAATRSGAGPLFATGNRLAWGFLEDAVYGVAGDIEATTAWSIAGAFEHLWTPSLKTSWYGSYIDISHNGNATALICAGNTGPGLVYGPTCNPDWTAWTAGSRTEWQPVQGLTFGVDVIYQQIQSVAANTGGVPGAVTITGQGGKPGGAFYTSDDLGVWSGAFRVQRNFLP